MKENLGYFTHSACSHLQNYELWDALVGTRFDIKLWNTCEKAKGRERLAVSKQAEQKFDVERFNFRKLN